MRLRLFLAALLLASVATVGGVAADAQALGGCTIVAGSAYTSTRCTTYGSGVLRSQYAKHTCHESGLVFTQQGYRVGINQVSTAGYCDGYITNRQVVQAP